MLLSRKNAGNTFMQGNVELVLQAKSTKSTFEFAVLLCIFDKDETLFNIYQY
jgi:hypothetical protein